MKGFFVTTFIALTLFLLVYAIGDGAVAFYRDCVALYETGAYEDLVYKIVFGVLFMYIITRKSDKKCKKEEKENENA